MTIKKTHGGARYHPPGREGGRPKNQYPKQLLVISCTPEEKRRIELHINTRERAEILLTVIDDTILQIVQAP